MDSININAQNAGEANVDGLAVPVAPGNQGNAPPPQRPTRPANPNQQGKHALYELFYEIQEQL